MTPPQALAPKPMPVTINGQHYNLVAFYYPGYETDWDKVYQAKFLTNFYVCDPKITLTIKGITASFHTAEAAFQATKCWSSPADLKAFENAPTGKAAYQLKVNLTNPDDDQRTGYAGLGQMGAMEAVLTQKFRDPILKQGLLLTGDAYLLEHNETKGRDKAGWSDDKDGLGRHAKNMLGLALMKVRAACGGVDAPAVNYTIADFTNNVQTK